MSKSQPRARQDFIRMACTSASVSYRELLTSDELISALISGKVPENRRPHLRTLLEESSPPLMTGLLDQVGKRGGRGKVVANLRRIAVELDVLPRVQAWLESI